jgi:hypothetical protein
MPRRGRPPVLDDQKKDAVCQLLARGYSGRAAAEELHLPPATLYMALRRDPAFAARADVARRQAQGLPQRRTDDWRIAARALARLDPARYGSPGATRRRSSLFRDPQDEYGDDWRWLDDLPLDDPTADGPLPDPSDDPAPATSRSSHSPPLPPAPHSPP